MVEGILQTNMSPYLVSCKACGRTYDGNAQCCFDMDHVRVESFSDHVEEIRGFVKSNPELIRRLEAMERLYQDEILNSEELGNDCDRVWASLDVADEKAKIDKDSIKLLAENMYRLETENDELKHIDDCHMDDNQRLINNLENENDELKKQADIMRAPAEEYYSTLFKST